MRFGLMIWVGMALPATAAEQVPALVNLPKLQPLTPTEVTTNLQAVTLWTTTHALTHQVEILT